MQYQIITVEDFFRDVYNGYMKFYDLDYSQYRGWDNNFEITRSMLNEMLKGTYSRLIRVNRTNDGMIIDSDDSYNMMMFYNIIKHEVSEGEKEWNMYYFPEGDVFGGNPKLSECKLNCRSIFSTVLYLNEVKVGFAKEYMKLIERMVATIHRYPLCFAVIDKRWEK